MVTVHRHNPVLRNRLLQPILADNPEGLKRLLQQLSVAEKRTAGYLLAEELLPKVPSKLFWNLFQTIVPSDSKAYLGTFLKAAVALSKAKQLSLDEVVLQDFSESATPIDVRKILDALLPCVFRMEDAQLLLRLFCPNHPDWASSHLLKAGTPLSYYLLFNLLKTVESDHERLRHYTVLLMKKGDHLSFNLASIIRQYFDLEDVPGCFSLKLEPYELGRLDQGPDLFIKLLKS